jgi:hypothetical protein
VTPQPSTKHLTDEELKQQYGIHLTSRLEADGDGKEAKWADIDDDEDDWAPETIEWNDGTKTTLTAADLTPTTPAQTSDPAAPGAAPKVLAERPKPPQFTSSVGPNATVLKLGASAEKQQAQKAAAEKTKPLENSRSTPSNVVPAPAPAKSPWAVLPPVDKASPIDIQPQPMMPLHRAGSSYGMPPPLHQMHASSPAKEISADDFNRTWKDGSQMQPRELYMPNSGRYEAVSDGRRRMSRNDQGFRAPAVLQRPTGNDSQNPAEPSAAFQTTRTSSDATRRRSSIVSGGSGQIARRLSMKSGDHHALVFDSQSADLSARPGSRDGPLNPLDAQQQTLPSVTAPAASAGPAYDIEAEREKQKQLMKESGLRARQRRLEEEAKAEAEKKERLRKKLEALEAAAPPKKEPEPAVTEEVTDPAPILEAPRLSQSASHSPPKPPQPLATGEPQQYGMIKVHALDSNKRLSTDQQRPLPSRDSQVPGVNGVKPVESQRPLTADQPTTASEPSPKLPKPSTADARSGWGDLRDHRPQAANLWGISSNKALGNGTFDQSLAGYAPQDLSRTSSGAPGWNGRTPLAGRSPHIAEAKLPLASPDQGPLAADSEADTLFPVVPPVPIGRPPHQAAHVNGGPSNNVAAWNNFHQTAVPQERAEAERHQRELVARREEEARTGVRQGPSYTFNETWKQVQIGDQPTQRHNVGKSSSAVPAQFGAVGSLPTGPGQRNSRFFPSPVQPLATEVRRAVTYSYREVPRSPSPPPAEEYASEHPAFDGKMQRPAVRFPREKAVVKLPPAGPPTPPAEPEELKVPLTWAARAAMAAQPQPRAVSMPAPRGIKWQERFNGLLGRHERPVEIESSSRDSLDVVPRLKDVSTISMPTEVITKGPYATKEVESEEDLFEDRELASLPTISLPVQKQPLVSLPLAPRPRHVFSNRLDISSAEAFFYPAKAQFALIHFPGAQKSTRIDLPSKNGLESASAPKARGGGGKHGNSFRGHSSRGGRGRGAAKAAAVAS